MGRIGKVADVAEERSVCPSALTGTTEAAGVAEGVVDDEGELLTARRAIWCPCTTLIFACDIVLLAVIATVKGISVSVSSELRCTCAEVY